MSVIVYMQKRKLYKDPALPRYNTGISIMCINEDFMQADLINREG